MFAWRKDSMNLLADEVLIEKYPWLHYRPRKKNAIEVAGNVKRRAILNYIYSFKPKVSKWELLKGRSIGFLKELLISVKRIIENNKPLSLWKRGKRRLRKIKELARVVLDSLLLKNYLTVNRSNVITLQDRELLNFQYHALGILDPCYLYGLARATYPLKEREGYCKLCLNDKKHPQKNKLGVMWDRRDPENHWLCNILKEAA